MQDGRGLGGSSGAPPMVAFMSGTNPMAGVMLGGRAGGTGGTGAAYWGDMSHVHRGGRRGGRRVGVAGAAYIGSGGGKTGTRRRRRGSHGTRRKGFRGGTIHDICTGGDCNWTSGGQRVIHFPI